METAEECVDQTRKKQPDWFHDFVDILMPLVTAKRKALYRFLQNGTTVHKKKFRRHQKFLKKAVDEAKEARISRVVREAECAGRNGKQRWTSYQEVTEGPCRKESCVINSAVQKGLRNDEWARGSEGDVA